MEFKNLTPFDTLCYSMLDAEENEFHVVTMKVAYNVHNGGCIVNDDNIAKLCVQDQFVGGFNKSSVLYESDLAPYKPLCDVIINATAYSPGNKPTLSFPVTVLIKNQKNSVLLNKTLLVQGEQLFQPYLWSWDESEIEPFTKLAIDYQYAFGGENKIYSDNKHADYVKDKDKLSKEALESHPEENPPIAHTAFEDNVLGCGFADRWFMKVTQGQETFEVPRIVYPDVPFDLSAFKYQLKGPRDTKSFEPAGFGFVSRTATKRRLLAGTYDDNWLEHRHPYLPHDFSFSYWNGAPIDQQIPYPDTNIHIVLDNLSPKGKWEATLPPHRPFLLLRLNSGAMAPAMMRLDTMIIEPELNQILLTYRFAVPIVFDVRVIEARFEVDPNAPLVTIVE